MGALSYILFGGAFFLMLGLPMLLLGAGKFWQRLLIALVFTSLGLLMAFGINLEHSSDIKNYNDGVCSCGGHYEFVNASRWRSSTTYYYECDICGHVLETSSAMK